MIENIIENSYNKKITGSAALLGIIICIVFGTNSVAMKTIILSGTGPYTSGAIRCFIGSVGIFLWAILTGKSFYIPRKNIPTMIIYCLIFNLQMGLMHKGISYTHASHFALITNLQPFFVLLFAHYFIPEDKISLRKIIGILVGMAGASFLFIKKGIWSDVYTGDIIVLCAVFVWAVNAIYLKLNSEKFSSLNFIMYPSFFSAVTLFLAGWLFDDIMIPNITLKLIGAFFYTGLLVSGIGFVLWTSLLQKYGAVALHSFVFIMPIVGVTGGVLVLNESFTLKIFASMLFITLGIIVVNSEKKYATLQA